MTQRQLNCLEQEVKARFGELSKDSLGGQMSELSRLIGSGTKPDCEITEEQFNLACQALDLIHQGTATDYNHAQELLSRPSDEIAIVPEAGSSIPTVFNQQIDGMVETLPGIFEQQKAQFEDDVNNAVWKLLDQKLSDPAVQARIEAETKRLGQERKQAGKDQHQSRQTSGLHRMLGLTSPPPPKRLPGSSTD